MIRPKNQSLGVQLAICYQAIMKKLIVSLSIVTALALPVFAGEKSEKPAEKKACCAEKAKACSEKGKAGCHGKSSCQEKSATKSSSSAKGAEILKQ